MAFPDPALYLLPLASLLPLTLGLPGLTTTFSSPGLFLRHHALPGQLLKLSPSRQMQNLTLQEASFTKEARELLGLL